MIRGTTPTLTFTLPFEPTGIVKDVSITFLQGEGTILEKKLVDCEIDGVDMRLRLTREDTMKFSPCKWIKIRVDMVCMDDNVITADLIYDMCCDV